MTFTCRTCKWWASINGACVCGYSGRPTVMEDSCEAWDAKEPNNDILTNADRIRAMSDEELAEFMNHGACPPGEDVSELCCDEDGGSVPDMCNLCWLKWLKEEAEG